MTQEGIVLKGRISQTMNIAGHLVNPQEVEDRLIFAPRASGRGGVFIAG